MNLTLDQDENIELIIDKKKHFPFRKDDFLKMLILLFLIPFSQLFLKNGLEKIGNSIFNIYYIFFIAILIYLIFHILNNYYRRYLNVFKWKHIITNKRLIIANNDQIIDSFWYNNFPKIDFEENIFNNNGSIIIGGREPLLGVNKTIISYRMGVNFSENDIIIYNTKAPRDIYNNLKSKIDMSKKDL